MLHACFVRSPHPHARIAAVDIEAAKRRPASTRCSSRREINPRCEPFVGVALHRPGHRSAPQRLLADGRAVWQGQPVAMVVADSRAEAEDAAELVSDRLGAAAGRRRAPAGGRSRARPSSIPSSATTSLSTFRYRRASLKRPGRRPMSSSKRCCGSSARWR